jgi:hypothetical protein
VAALKLLKLAPLCPDRGESLSSGIGERKNREKTNIYPLGHNNSLITDVKLDN